ncbi:serine/threonine-protein kinase [Silvibacterium dinghuense]|nr:serine/threonine-protein kinase [Silvibacterium dinghuense]
MRELRNLALEMQSLLGARWEVLDCLALGGMATILQLRHRIHKGLFVAKALRPELADRPEILRSFHAEARNASLVGGHPNAVPVFDVLDAGGLPVLLMPFIEGEDLDAFIQRHGPLSRIQTLQFATQISSLLCHAESYGISHGDLSPGNIRLDQFGRYRVLDFGLSRMQNNDDPYQPFSAGTPLYTSPEQLRGEAPDIRTDLYELGLVIVEVMTGKPLMQADSLKAIRQRHLDGISALPAAIEADAPLARLLRRMLARERSERLRGAAELSRALEQLGFQPQELMRPDAASTRRGRISTR